MVGKAVRASKPIVGVGQPGEGKQPSIHDKNDFTRRSGSSNSRACSYSFGNDQLEISRLIGKYWEESIRDSRGGK